MIKAASSQWKAFSQGIIETGSRVGRLPRPVKGRRAETSRGIEAPGGRWQLTMSQILLRLVLILLPLGLTPVLMHLIGYGYLNFGGGCKDVVLLIPWMVWSLIYLIISLVCWRKHWSIAKGIAYSTIGATGVLVLLSLVLLVGSSIWLGFK